MYQETSLKTDRMIYANTRSDEADMDYRMHCHNSYEIYYIITGNVEYLLEGRDCRPRPGTLIIIAPDCFHGLKVLDGQNTHHIIEALFKAFAKALDEAAMFDGRITDVMSTKGTL